MRPLLCVLLLLGACAPSNEGGEEGSTGIDEARESPATVDQAVSTTCTTASVRGLSQQLIDEIQCLRPGTMKSIEKLEGVTLGSAVFPWLQAPAADALDRVQKERTATLHVNSALRALPQQYLLYRWYRAGRCGIGLAASPGTSNHEDGLALDVDDNAAWRTAMSAHGFRWLGSSDPVHFDYVGGGVDLGGLSVKAFQRLWNRNHAEDPIAEDGDYGPATEARLARSPTSGFAKGATCGGPSAPPAPPPPMNSDDERPARHEPEGARQTSRPYAELSGAQGCATGSGDAPWLAGIVLGAGLLLRRRR